MNAVTENTALDQKDVGLYNKFTVTRNDGSSNPGGKREHDEYFVLSLTTDKFAIPAIRAYAASCAAEYPALAADLNAKLRARQADNFVAIPETVVPLNNGQTLTVPAFNIAKYLGTVVGEHIEIASDLIPTVDISFYDTNKICDANKMPLLRESQALSLAYNLSQVDANWTGGKVGVGNLRQGLRKDSVEGAQRNDFVPEDSDESRAFYLPDGSEIYDAAGHLYTWVWNDVSGDGTGLIIVKFAPDCPSICAAPFPSMENGVGWYPKAGANWSGDALVRGGCWGSDDNAGVFRLDSDRPDYGSDDFGFRCTLP